MLRPGPQKSEARQLVVPLSPYSQPAEPRAGGAVTRDGEPSVLLGGVIVALSIAAFVTMAFLILAVG